MVRIVDAAIVMDPYYREFGARIKSARGPRSQAELAAASGLSRAVIANIESGRVRVAIDALDRLAQALDVDPASLLPRRQSGIAQLDAANLMPSDRRAIERVLARVDALDDGADAAG